MSEANHKYKEDTPLKTINKIRKLLSQLDILLVEQWLNSMEGIYSVRVEIAGTNVGQNGKGTSPEYALASAYAEFMERLQNRLMYNELDLCGQVDKHGGFYFAPDERYLTVDELLDEDNDLLKVFLAPDPTCAEPDGEVENLISRKMMEWFPSGTVDQRSQRAKKWATLSPEGCSADFVAVPFYNVKDENLCNVPHQMLRVAYGSNGTCAGNTTREALVQGLSEIMERHVHKRIFSEKIVPPTVPNDYISKFPEMYNLVQSMEGSGKYRIIIKDCSLGQGYPVVGVIIINREQQSYFVKFGAHPDFEIALERCLTEVLQGRDLNNGLSGMMTRFDYCDPRVDLPENHNAAFRIGIGSYFAEFFSNDFSYEFSEFKNISGLGNHELLTYLNNLIIELGYTVLIRDVSYLGFPSFQIIVPGMSEIYPFNDQRLGIKLLREEVKAIVRNLPEASDRELHKVVSYIIRQMGYVMEGDHFTRLLGFPVNSTFPWHKIPNYVFISAVLFKMKKVQEAYGMMKKYVEANRLTGTAAEDETRFNYYCCVRDYLGALAGGAEQQKVIDILNTIYPGVVVEEVLTHWGSPEEVLSDYGDLKCWNCQECKHSRDCSQDYIKNLHVKIKERQADCPIEQSSLKELFI